MSLIYGRTEEYVSINQNQQVRERSRTPFLDRALESLLSGEVEYGMRYLVRQLFDTYSASSTKEWALFVQNELNTHPVRNMLMQDPLTSHAARRPRGYAGDAALLDLIYFPENIGRADATELGLQIYSFTTGTNIAHALRERKAIIAQKIAQTARELNNASILSVACGHCREIDMVDATDLVNTSRFLGVDQDQRSLDHVDRKYGYLGVSTSATSVADIAMGRANHGSFDLIYSAGLYDYLSTNLAQRLTARLYRQLRPGGKLIVFNIVPDYEEIGYFESFLNWQLIGRNEEDMLALSANIPAGEIADAMVTHGETRGFHYLEITRR